MILQISSCQNQLREKKRTGSRCIETRTYSLRVSLQTWTNGVLRRRIYTRQQLRMSHMRSVQSMTQSTACLSKNLSKSIQIASLLGLSRDQWKKPIKRKMLYQALTSISIIILLGSKRRMARKHSLIGLYSPKRKVNLFLMLFRVLMRCQWLPIQNSTPNSFVR